MPDKFKLRRKKGLGVDFRNDPLIENFTVHKKQRSMSVLHLDLTMSQSEDAIAKHEMRKYFNTLKGKTAFDDWELACVLHIYFKLTQKQPLSRRVFRDFMHNVFGMSRTDMVDRIYSALDEPGRDVVGIKAQNFIKLMAVYCRGSLEEKISFVFDVYDSLFLGYIGRETMVKLLVPTLLGGQKHENVETAIDMADLLMRKFDFDRDGRVTFDEFAGEIRKNPEQIELCGQENLQTTSQERSHQTTRTLNASSSSTTRPASSDLRHQQGIRILNKTIVRERGFAHFFLVFSLVQWLEQTEEIT